MNFKMAVTSTLFATLATGCGGGSGPDPETGYTDGKNCPQSMIDARNDVSFDCQAAATISSFDSESEITASVSECRNSIRRFLDENPNVYCKATSISQGEEVYVDSERLRSLLNDMNEVMNSLD